MSSDEELVLSALRVSEAPLSPTELRHICVSKGLSPEVHINTPVWRLVDEGKAEFTPDWLLRRKAPP